MKIKMRPACFDQRHKTTERSEDLQQQGETSPGCVAGLVVLNLLK